MTRYFATAALAAVLSSAALAPSFAQMSGQAGPMMGMMGGGCMMGQNMMGSGMMGQGVQGMMRSGPMGMGGGMGTRGAMGQGMMGQRMMGAAVEGRLAYLKSALKITDTQSQAWNDYVEAVKDRLSTMQAMRDGMMSAMQTGSAIDRMNARISAMETMVEALKAVMPATENLYDGMTDEQKKVADQLIGMDCGAM